MQSFEQINIGSESAGFVKAKPKALASLAGQALTGIEASLLIRKTPNHLDANL